jgi:hypothetical protein
MPKRIRKPIEAEDLVPDEEIDGTLNKDPEIFLAQHHPQNDDFMRSLQHVQRQIMHISNTLRPKQVTILKALFSGMTNIAAAKLHSTTAPTVSNLKNSTKGQDLLSMLQYHQQMIEGPNIAQRRSMLWRIAVREELIDPKTSIKATEALNKMTFQEWEQSNPTNGQAQPSQVTININQELLPKGNLD